MRRQVLVEWLTLACFVILVLTIVFVQYQVRKQRASEIGLIFIIVNRLIVAALGFYQVHYFHSIGFFYVRLLEKINKQRLTQARACIIFVTLTISVHFLNEYVRSNNLFMLYRISGHMIVDLSSNSYIITSRIMNYLSNQSPFFIALFTI